MRYVPGEDEPESSAGENVEKSQRTTSPEPGCLPFESRTNFVFWRDAEETGVGRVGNQDPDFIARFFQNSCNWQEGSRKAPVSKAYAAEEDASPRRLRTVPACYLLEHEGDAAQQHGDRSAFRSAENAHCRSLPYGESVLRGGPEGVEPLVFELRMKRAVLDILQMPWDVFMQAQPHQSPEPCVHGLASICHRFKPLNTPREFRAEVVAVPAGVYDAAFALAVIDLKFSIVIFFIVINETYCFSFSLSFINSYLLFKCSGMLSSMYCDMFVLNPSALNTCLCSTSSIGFTRMLLSTYVVFSIFIWSMY